MPGPKPTKKQIAALEKFGINPPPTKPSCENTLNFLFRGISIWSMWQLSERCKLIQELQKKWNGVEVVSSVKSRGVGKVHFISAKGQYMFFENLRDFSKRNPGVKPLESPDDNRENFAFYANVTWENGEKINTPLHALSRVR